MSFLRAGYPMMALSGATACAVLAVSVWRRSWALWLLGFALFAVAVCVAFSFRSPPTTAPHTEPAAVLP